MITMTADKLQPGYIICKRGGGRYCKIISVLRGEEITVKYTDNMIEVFKKTHELKVIK